MVLGPWPFLLPPYNLIHLYSFKHHLYSDNSYMFICSPNLSRGLDLYIQLHIWHAHLNRSQVPRSKFPKNSFSLKPVPICQFSSNWHHPLFKTEASEGFLISPFLSLPLLPNPIHFKPCFFTSKDTLNSVFFFFYLYFCYPGLSQSHHSPGSYINWKWREVPSTSN